MTCPNCNSQYNDNLASCPFCSVQQAPVAPQQAPFEAPQQTPFQAPQGAFVAPPAPVKKKKKSALISVIIIAIFAIIGIIGAIGENKEATYTFTKEMTDVYSVSDIEYTLKCKGDTVIEIIIVTDSEFSDVDEDELAEFYEEFSAEQEEEYEDYDFITYSYEIDGLHVIEKVTIKDASDHVTDLEELELLEDAGDGEFISYEKTADNLKDDGFKLVED